VAFPIEPPIEPMLAKPQPEIPRGDGWRYEPKWDGFRAIVFRNGPEVYIQSRDLKPLNRYFPELEEPLRKIGRPPDRFVLDGEIVIATDDGLDFDSLLIRIHPAASRVAMLAEASPASYVAFDLLGRGDRDLRETALAKRREALERMLAKAPPSVLLTPATDDPETANRWFADFEGAGLDGVVAKRADGHYVPGKREMIKVKHQRTADCVVAGFRWHKNGPGTMVGSLLLGLYDGAGTLQSVGVTSSFTEARRRELVEELKPLRKDALKNHPWQEWKEAEAAWAGQRMPGATSRWNRGKDLSWEPLRIERVVEVAYDHLQRDRFRHATTFLRWRPDRKPASCRYDQLEETAPALLADLFASH
jgi:ATP-dependent DNA ligase